MPPVGFHQESGCRPTPYTARPLGPAGKSLRYLNPFKVLKLARQMFPGRLFQKQKSYGHSPKKKHLESVEMWCWRRVEKTSLTDHVRNEVVLLRVKE